MAPRRKLLFISPCTPDPQGTGWEQRAFAFLSAYSKFMDVELWFTPTNDNPELRRIVKLAHHCASIRAFYPAVIDDPRSPLRRSLGDALAISDVVHVFRMHQLVALISHRFMVWDIDEWPWRKLHETSGNLQRDTAERYSICFRKCRLVFASSDAEKHQANHDGIVVIPNIAHVVESVDSELIEKRATLLFVGNLNYPPNIEALMFLDDSILPELARLIDNAVVNVIGRSPTGKGARAAVERLRDTGRFRFVFDPPSCRLYYLQAAAAIVPIRIGGGTRIKIIEAFGNRCPVISTTKGCEGLGVAHRKQLLIADSPEDFAAACAELLRSPEAATQMTNSAYTFFEHGHSQKVVDRLIVSAIEALFQTRNMAQGRE